MCLARPESCSKIGVVEHAGCYMFSYKRPQFATGSNSHSFPRYTVSNMFVVRYYLFGPHTSAFKPLVLVPLDQVQTLITEIGQEFQIDISVPSYPFQMSFYSDHTPKPTLIGVVNSKADMTDIQARIPNIPDDYDIMPDTPTETQVSNHAAWKKKVERAFEAEKKRKGAMRKKRYQRHETRIVANFDSLQRAQRYLGLRQKLPITEVVRYSSSSEEQRFGQARDAGFNGHALDVTRAAPYPFEDDTVIISVDVESWEMDHSIITEIGLSTLDTADIKDVALGTEGEDWIRRIRSRHFRIKGRESLKNFKFCQGYPDMFRFGTSEFVTTEGAPGLVDSCFEYPYSAGFECEGCPQNDNEDLPLQRIPATLDTSRGPNDDDKPRTLLLVGHDITGDIAYLSSLGSTIFGTSSFSSSDGTPSRRQRVLSSIRERFDTATLHKSLIGSKQTQSLMKVCNDLNITPWYAHNAGNDARYTLEAFIKMVIKSRQQGDEASAILQNAGKSKIEKTV